MTIVAMCIITVLLFMIGYAIWQISRSKEMEEGINGMVEITPQIKHALNELKYMDDDKIFQTIVLDFDATCVEHRYPETGKSLPLCVETLKRWQKEYKVGYILSTMRSGKLLENAVNWFKENNIELFGIQKHPTQEEWTDSPKAHGRYCIDDRNVGIPLTLDSYGVPCVDWKVIAEIFEPTLKGVYEIIEEQKKFFNK